jgi:hypothetical protein
MPFAVVKEGDLQLVVKGLGDIYEVSRWTGDNSPARQGEHPLNRVSLTIRSTQDGAIIDRTTPQVDLSRTVARVVNTKDEFTQTSLDLGLGLVILPLTIDEAERLYAQMLESRNK